MHTATINRIAVDAAGRYLVTGSEDKTVRVWDPATGRLLRTLRLPIGTKMEGIIYAVAITPNGRFIAAGGWTGYQWEDFRNSVYIFDRQSGRMKSRINGFTGTIFTLAFSPDGKKLAVATFRGGVRVFNVADGTEILINGEDEYGSPEIYGLDFDRAGRLVTSCADGYLRLYDRNMTLLKKVSAPGGKRLYAVRFAPNGTKVAVGYDDIARVDVLDGNSLKPLYQPDTSGMGKGDLRAVAWSADGLSLYAGGGWSDKTGVHRVRRWAGSGRGRYRDLAAAGATIMDLAPLPSGGAAFGSDEPSWGVFSATGRRAQFVVGETADYRENQQGLLTDLLGAEVGFAYESSGKSPARFSLWEGRLRLGKGDSLLMRPPQIDGLPITDWKDSDDPKLNGNPLRLTFYGEKSRCLAIDRAQEKFLLGSDLVLTLYDRDGKVLWRTGIPASPRSVNISGSGKVAIAALGDGTIRWYRMTDGKELLAFFPSRSRNQWIIWSPDGYYYCSPGADNLIGWHVNNSKDQAADFFPAGRFRNLYYRPSISQRVTDLDSTAEDLRQPDEKPETKEQEVDLRKRLPPVIDILSPSDDSEVRTASLVVRYNLRSPSGEPVTGVKVLIDGRPAGVERGVGARPQNGRTGEQTGELTVNLPHRDCELGLVAENKYASSEVSIVKLRWRGGTDSNLSKPKLYVLAIGVAQYQNPSWNLNFAAKDARDFVAATRSQEGGLYRKVEFKLLTDQQATKDNILDGLEWIKLQTTSRDVAMVFFAGHGINDNLNRYFFCSHNFEEQSLMRTGVAYSDIRNAAEAIAGKALFFVDTCHAGNAIGSRSRGASADIIGLVNELSSVENGVIVFTAATGRQNSLEDAQWNNGAFTKALVEGLNGNADFKRQGKITVSMLDFYVSERVKELTGGKQTPATVKPETVPDFPIAIRK
jgi:WD40 repeat protein